MKNAIQKGCKMNTKHIADEPTQFMGTQEASNYIGVSLDQFRRLMRMGFIKGFQLKPRTPHMFTQEELDGYLREVRSKTG